MALYTFKRTVREGEVGTIEIAPFVTTLPKPTITDIDTARLALDALTYTPVGEFSEFTDTLVRENATSFFSDKCGSGEFAEIFDESKTVSFNRWDANDWEVMKTFMDVYETTTLTSLSQAGLYGSKDAKFVVIKFTLCPLLGTDITGASDPTKNIVETYYYVKQALDGDLVKTWYAGSNSDTTPAPTPITFGGKKGGYWIAYREEVAA